MEKDPKLNERTEEVQEIISRMPSAFGIKISIFVAFIVAVMLSFGWIVKYPDVVNGSVTINANTTPIKLVANSSGKLNLNGFKDQDKVREGDYVAVIQNPANTADMRHVAKLLTSLNLKEKLQINTLKVFPRNVSLGEINIKYYTFLNALSQSIQHYNENLYDQQDIALRQMVQGYQRDILITKERLKVSEQNLALVRKNHTKDSTLLAKKVLSEVDNDRSVISLLNAKDAYQNILRDNSNAGNQLRVTENQISQNHLQKIIKEKQLEMDLITAFSELEDYIKNWEQKYVLKSPISGRVQFLKFYRDGQYVQSSENVFTIVPEDSNVLGQMTLPAWGAGKVRVNQEVIIKLDNYPYMEYGSIKGIVSSIAMTTTSVTTNNGPIETYMVNISLPDKLKTNYGSVLNFKFEIKGSGEIITNERRLVERLFDNLKYKYQE